MSETWRVIDEAGAVHEIEVGQVRGSAAWCARVRSYEAPVVHSDPRGAVVIAAMRDGVGVAEVLAPGERSREEMADEVAHLEDRRGALLAEIDRLTARGRVAWGAMPTVAEVKEHARRGGLWATRDSTLPDELVTLDVRKGKVVFRRTNGKAWCALIIASGQWRAITGEEVARG